MQSLIDHEAVRRARNAGASEAELERLAETFQVLASPTRLRLVEALAEGEMCVNDLAALTGVSATARRARPPRRSAPGAGRS